jgi:hypothetical protein
MKLLRLVALLAALAPTQALAGSLLSESEVKFLVQTCFASFYHPAGQPFQVDRGRFAEMGFSVLRDDTGKFEAQRILDEKVSALKKVRFGPLIEIRRNKNKPQKLLYKVCGVMGDSGHLNSPQITDLTSKKVNEMLEAEAERLGFKPYRNRKSKVVWIKGEVAVFLSVSFEIKRGESVVLGSQPPVRFYIDGVHPKDLRGISQ